VQQLRTWPPRSTIRDKHPRAPVARRGRSARSKAEAARHAREAARPTVTTRRRSRREETPRPRSRRVRPLRRAPQRAPRGGRAFAARADGRTATQQDGALAGFRETPPAPNAAANRRAVRNPAYYSRRKRHLAAGTSLPPRRATSASQAGTSSARGIRPARAADAAGHLGLCRSMAVPRRKHRSTLTPSRPTPPRTPRRSRRAIAAAAAAVLRQHDPDRTLVRCLILAIAGLSIGSATPSSASPVASGGAGSSPPVRAVAARPPPRAPPRSPTGLASPRRSRRAGRPWRSA